MKARAFVLVIAVAFAMGLAYTIGQRLSAEAMAVMIGVVAGVAASIPTSLIVVWFATRSTLVYAASAGPVTAPLAPEPPEPQIVVVAQPPQAAPAYQHYAGAPASAAAPTAYGISAPHASAAEPLYGPPASGQRHFTVIGGAETLGDLESNEEAPWPS